MAQIRQVEIPIICENEQCQNFGNVINVISEIAIEDLDLFYENFDDSVEEDHCIICGELGVAEDPIFKKI